MIKVNRNFWAKLIVIFILTICVNQHAYSYYKFETFSNEEGFNQNTINAIEQDSYGFLWFGTPNGLYRYDGYQFKSYTYNMPPDLSISNNFITSLHTDSLGVLWIGTKEGLNVYIPWLEKFMIVPSVNKLRINSIHSDFEGRVWVSGLRKLFICELIHKNGEIVFSRSKDILKSNTPEEDIQNICFIDTQSFLLINTMGLKRAEFTIDKAKNLPIIQKTIAFELFSELSIKHIKKINDTYWIGTNNGLYKTMFEGNNLFILKHYENFKSINGNFITSIFEDNFGSIWIGTTNEGLAKYSPESDSFDYFGFDAKNENGISSKRINCIFQDKYNVLWLGTAQGGINKLDLMQKPFLNYEHNPYDKTSIPGNLISSIMEDSKGRLWLSSFGEGVCRSITSVNDTNIEHLKFQQLDNTTSVEEQSVVLTFFEDNKGLVWMGTTKGLLVYNPIKESIKPVLLKHNGSIINVRMLRIIKQIDDKHILFGGISSVIVENPWNKIETASTVTIEVDQIVHELSNNLLQCFQKDSKGKLWMGTREGLFSGTFKNEQLSLNKTLVKQQSDTNEINSNIFSLLEDSAGNMWIGTFGKGLKKIRADKKGEYQLIDQYTKNNILPDDAIYGIIQEDQDHLWLSTDMGLCRLNTQLQKSELFDVRDGLPSNNFRQAAYLKGHSGYFYFGGLRGLTIFKPEEIKHNEILPKVLITNLSVNNKSIRVGAEKDGEVRLQKSIIATNSITLKHDEQIIAFEAVVQHSNAPFKNKLQYKLEGFSEKWILAETGKTSITYTNLPAGDYILKLKGANADGLWNDKSTDLHIKVLPPWYKRWWSYLIFTLLIVGIIIGVAIYYIQLVELTKNLKYEKLDKKRIDALNNAKLRFFTNISHEFRTPLTLIAGPLDQMLEKNANAHEKKNLSIINNNTKRLLRLVDQLITFRKAEQGYMELNYSRCALDEFISPITDAFEEYGIQKNINFFYKISSPNEVVIIDVDKMERILFNLLSNSFKHTPAHGNISIETVVENTEKRKLLVLKVIDNGTGIPKEKQDKIFQRFYQLEGRKENLGGTGIGLALCKTLVDIMDGEISIDSTAHVRTCFTVSIPCDVEDKIHQNEFVAKSSIKDWIPMQILDDEETPSQPAVEKSANNILIVEDEPEVRDFIKNSLNEKYKVETVENGAQAIDWLAIKTPNLIISDVMMPEMDGFELCEKIKSQEATSHIPVILLTALGDNDNRIKGLEYGADDYISKPFSLRHLQLRVDKLIENNAKLKKYFQSSSKIPDPEISISGRDKKFLNKIIDAIEKNISDPYFGVEELAKEIGISTAHFYRRLKSITGQIPNVYLRNYRLERAASFLKENTGDNLSEIMSKVGFQSNSYFSTAFKKLYGCSPSEYLKKG